MNWSKNNGFTAGHVALALVGGTALGVGIGLLVAPQSGAKSRADIFQRAAAARKHAWQLEQEVVMALENGAGAVASSVEEGVASVKRQLHV